MKSELVLRILGLLILLGLGMLVAQIRPQSREIHPPGFHESLWLTRRADWIVQLGLLLVGALGIRALLPSADEEKEDNQNGPMA